MPDDDILNHLRQLVPGAGSLEAAVRSLSRLGIPPEALGRVRRAYEEESNRIRTLDIPTGIDSPHLPTPWYNGPHPDDRFWPAFQRTLVDRGLTKPAISMVDRASTAVLSRMAAPGTSTISTRGLVVGYVQSGKTTNFMAVIAKAADVGYRLFIVLAGLTNSLRRQTQQRLDAQLIDRNQVNWFKLTNKEQDFGGQDNFSIIHNRELRVIGAVKKNPSRLRRLNAWLDRAPAGILDQLPILVIDDEADQASVNASTREERTRINDLLLKLLDRPKLAYVGYTATPFANLLIDPSHPQDLYPRDFIISLPQPEGHFGTERIFGREPLTHEEPDEASDGANMVRHIDDEELEHLRPPWNRELREAWEPRVTPSLDDAIRYFVLASAARAHRGTGNPHSTMLIHTTQLTDPQMRLRSPVEGRITWMENGWRRRDPDLHAQLRMQWDREMAKVPADRFDETVVPFDALAPHVDSVLTRLTVVVDNYRSDERLEYGSGARTLIVIGGNTLSRGITLEGLLVSYFARSVSMYDTLLQMGRWFGYRNGYADLPRIWMTSELEEWFIHLATVENEIRHEIGRYDAEDIGPTDFAVRIRTHPKLNITAAAKMTHAIDAAMSFSGRRVQTILFHHKDREWLQRNLAAARNLVRDARFAGSHPDEIGHGRWLLSDVPVRAVLSFLSGYQFHENSYDLKTDLIQGYISEQVERDDALRTWNVLVMGRGPGNRSVLDLGIDRPVGMISRSRMALARPYANIKALMSKVDMVADLGISSEALQSEPYENLIGMRPPAVGLLLLYPIDKDSAPRGPSRESVRKPLEAVEHVIGLGLVFPRSRFLTPQTYISADLSAVQQEALDVEHFDDLDTEGDYESPLPSDG